MSKELVNAPSARSWRDIPQPVKPRAMSRGGKWRLAAATVRTVAASAVVLALAGGAWLIVAASRERPGSVAPAAQAQPLSRPELRTDGVLTVEWVERVLALPSGAALNGLDLKQLSERLLTDGQVLTAVLSRRQPGTLVVHLTERLPVARVLADVDGQHRQLLVARDGVVFEGTGFSVDLTETLPWLGGVTITRKGRQFLPIAGMDAVNDLLTRAQLEAGHLYRMWQVVSLERLASDREIVIRTREPGRLTIVFGANGDFLTQLARLDQIYETMAARGLQPASIDLSHGPQVPVRTAPTPAVAGAPTQATERAAAPGIFFRSSPSSSPTKREL